MNVLLKHVLTASPAVPACADVPAWWQRHRALAAQWTVPIELAVAAGFASDRLGYAFASGYHAAGAALFGPHLKQGFNRIAALCATEDGGNHPRAIATQLREVDGSYRLDGCKSFVTMGSAAELLLVVASVGEQDGRNRLRVVAIDRRDGVRFEPGPATPFVPEIPHGRITFDNVRVAPAEVLEGDGYSAYLKPFRTVEDCHVHAALLGWLLQIGRRSNWPDTVLQQLTSTIVTVVAIAQLPPSDSAVHVALAGAFSSVRALVERIDWSSVDRPTRELWERDRVLLEVAGKARVARTRAAWDRLRQPH